MLWAHRGWPQVRGHLRRTWRTREALAKGGGAVERAQSRGTAPRRGAGPDRRRLPLGSSSSHMVSGTSRDWQGGFEEGREGCLCQAEAGLSSRMVGSRCLPVERCVCFQNLSCCRGRGLRTGYGRPEKPIKRLETLVPPRAPEKVDLCPHPAL